MSRGSFHRWLRHSDQDRRWRGSSHRWGSQHGRSTPRVGRARGDPSRVGARRVAAPDRSAYRAAGVDDRSGGPSPRPPSPRLRSPGLRSGLRVQPPDRVAPWSRRKAGACDPYTTSPDVYAARDALTEHDADCDGSEVCACLKAKEGSNTHTRRGS